MLIFKRDIYNSRAFADRNATFSVNTEDYTAAYPYNFINTALTAENGILTPFASRQNPSASEEKRALLLYPYAHKIGGLGIITKLARILADGLEERDKWYHMNTYHFCLLHDVLRRYAQNYNNADLAARHTLLPELNGATLPFKSFILDYFFNTVFLLDEDKYNSMTAEEKKAHGYTCPCQFGVINGLTPSAEEMALQETHDYPYTIYV